MSEFECTGNPERCQICSVVGGIFAQFPGELDPGCTEAKGHNVPAQRTESEFWDNAQKFNPDFARNVARRVATSLEDVVDPKWANVFRNGAGKPVVALDIDGSLGDYHGHFLNFAHKYFGRPMPAPEAINPGLRLWEHMGVEHSEYREAKLAYRQGGWKRWMPAYSGASILTKELRAAGAEVWICTTRPYLRLDNIDPDTREWLRRNEIEYDAVLFGDDKYGELVRQVGLQRVVGIFDDLPDCLWKARSVGVQNIWMMDQPYNRHFKPDWVIRIDDLLWDLKDNLRAAVESYKERMR